MKKILITGCTGFIGSSLVSFFLSKKYDIIAISRKNISNSKIQFIKADIFDHKKINKLIKKTKPDYLIHLAWETDPKKYLNSKNNFQWLHSSLNLYLNFCKHGGKRALITGSCAEYDFNQFFLKEDFIKKKNYTRYSLCKEIFLNHAFKISKIYNTQLLWARLFWIYGLNQKKGRLIPDLIKSAKSKKKIYLKNPNFFINLLNVHDVSVALFKAFQSQLNGVINIADKKNIKVIDIANKCNHVFKNLNLKYTLKKKQNSRPYLVEIKKLNLLNFKKFYTLEKGLKKFL